MGREIPMPPKGLLKATREHWDRYWRSDLAQLAEPDTIFGGPDGDQGQKT